MPSIRRPSGASHDTSAPGDASHAPHRCPRAPRRDRPGRPPPRRRRRPTIRRPRGDCSVSTTPRRRAAPPARNDGAGPPRGWTTALSPCRAPRRCPGPRCRGRAPHREQAVVVAPGEPRDVGAGGVDQRAAPPPPGPPGAGRRRRRAGRCRGLDDGDRPRRRMPSPSPAGRRFVAARAPLARRRPRWRTGARRTSRPRRLRPRRWRPPSPARTTRPPRRSARAATARGCRPRWSIE